MAKHTQETLHFHPVNGKTVRADFNGGELSSDFGPLLLREMAIRRDIYDLAYAFAEHFLSSHKKPSKLAVIDLEHTASLTHGAQQYSLFNTKYGNTCYLPLMIFEGLSGKLITAILRPGKTPSGRENAAIVKRLLTLIRQSWPKAHLIIRGDSHFSQPELMRVVEQDKAADYVPDKGAGHPTALRPMSDESMTEARLKNDLSCDRTSDMSFRANALRMYYACAAYVLHYEMRTTVLKDAELQRAQPSTVIANLRKSPLKWWSIKTV